MKFYKLTIETLEPVIMGYDSSNESRDIISGTAINGIFIKENIKDFKRIGDLILSKNIIFTDAYLQNGEDYFIPTPKSFLCDKHDMKTLKNKNKDEKDKTIDIKNCLMKKKEFPDNEEGKIEKKKDEKRTEGLGSKYINIKNSDVIEIGSLKKIENMHINKNINDGMDSLYRYEAIEKGQKFYSLVILKNNENISKEHLEKIEGNKLIGKSKSAGYGKVKIELKDIEYKEFKEKLKIGQSKDDRKILNIYFLTDTILKDKYGNTVSILPEDEIKDLFGISGKVEKLDEQFVTNKIIGGYNSHQKIPMPKDTAIEAGSVIRYSYEGNLSGEIREKIEENGIGYFRERGFGRVIINPNFKHIKLGNYQEKKAQDTNEKENKNKVIINLNDEENNMFRLLEKSIKKEQKKSEIEKMVVDENKLKEIIKIRYLENSQINDLIEKIDKDEIDLENSGLTKDNVYNNRDNISIFNDRVSDFIKKLNDEKIEGYIETLGINSEILEDKKEKTEFIKSIIVSGLYYYLRGKENE